MPCPWLVFDAEESPSWRAQCARCRRRRTCARLWELGFALAGASPESDQAELAFPGGGEAGAARLGQLEMAVGDQLWPGAGLGEVAEAAVAWTWERSRCADQGPIHAPGR